MVSQSDNMGPPGSRFGWCLLGLRLILAYEVPGFLEANFNFDFDSRPNTNYKIPDDTNYTIPDDTNYTIPDNTSYINMDNPTYTNVDDNVKEAGVGRNTKIGESGSEKSKY